MAKFDMGPETMVAGFTAKGMPDALARYLIKVFEEFRGGMAPGPKYDLEVGVANVRRYAGREPMGFAEYLERHKREWQEA